MNNLTVKIGNLELANPVLTASGTFGYGEEFNTFLNLDKLGGLVTKAISYEPRPGNAAPRIAETPSGMLNSIGLANVGVKRFIEEKLPFLRKLKCAVIVNVAGKTEDEFVRVIEEIESAGGIDGYELNISCPNVKEGGMAFGTNPKITESITKKSRAATDKCLIVKMTPNVTSIGEIAKAAEASGADSVSVINTLVGMAVDIRSSRPKLATIRGGLSGPAIKPVAIAKVFEVAQAVKIPIIGIGGIMNYEDVIEFMITGATAIQVGTANFVNPCCAEQIVINLEKYLEEYKIKNIQQLIGSLKLS